MYKSVVFPIHIEFVSFVRYALLFMVQFFIMNDLSGYNTSTQGESVAKFSPLAL